MINFKLRLKNKMTLSALVSAVFVMLGQFGLDIPNNIQDGINTLLMILVILGIVTDPTTKGIADSERALNYDVPLDDKKGK
ncbi:holin [Streptococcus phage CHPC930]|uniref:Holin n=1 Tax=Streptococcus phage CHPC930 TaxID=2365051 RepID=A0A3G8FEW4_9CAUD|nr:holin [Streptococcus phage CHPC930]AZF92402.1 holin [Streptococcus phage CHPC930]